MSSRDRIVDAAAAVMRAEGVAGATTRQIARVAGCSEALLYKHFVSKQELFAAVLRERLPRLSSPDALVGVGAVPANLALLVAQLLDFYVQSFPMAASIFGTPALRDTHRAGMSQLGAGPDAPAVLLQAYLDAERDEGRISTTVDTRRFARALAGAALFESFQAAYAGEDAVPDVESVAHGIVEALVRGMDVA
jgi:AcrR family transcriptional regulator